MRHEKHEKHAEIKHEETKQETPIKTESKNKSPWFYSTIAMVVILAIVVAFSFTGAGVSNQLSSQEAANKTISFINDNLLQAGTTAKLISIEEEQDLYLLKIDVAGQPYNTYVTKDGRLFFTSGISMAETTATTATTATTVPPAAKVDKPEANAFIMSYCPYGLQFLKAYVPVMELLGSKADLSVNFVSYAMHGKQEIDENTRMYCIQKEQNSKFTAYLRCFVASGNGENCTAQAGLDMSKLNACINATDTQFNITGLYNDQSTWSGGRYPQYPVEAALSGQYGVGGSPTFVLNGQTVSVSRSAEAIKQAICSSFNNPPSECSQTLSTAQESPGIGPIGSSSSGSSGSCG